jgi:hypothetical protein
MKTIKLLALTIAITAASACGDNLKGPGGGGDDGGNNFPPPPNLGAQIDRMGRPAINTALNGTLDDNPLKTAKKDAYNHADTPANWATTEVDTGVTVLQEFQKYIAIFDFVDKDATVTGSGCGNLGLGYDMLAGVLADDELFVDTSIGMCGFYLSLEAEAASGGAVVHTHCGGRAPTDDIADTSYSFLFAGLMGFDPTMNFKPKFTDGAAVHADVNNDTFPFFGAPH